MAIDMTKLTSIQREVIERLEREYESCKTAGRHGAQLNGPVLNVLKGFCASNAEFATLLHDTDKTLKGCFEAVSEQGYSGTSDFEVYSNAIRYYLPGVTVHMTLWVDMQGVDEGVAFGRDGEATLDVYGKGAVNERPAKAAEKPKKADKSAEGKKVKGASSAPAESGKAAEVLPMPQLGKPNAAKQQAGDDLGDGLLDVPTSKPKKILSFDFLDLEGGV